MSCAVAVHSRSRDQFLEGLNLENCAPTTTGARFQQNRRFRKNTEKVIRGDLFWDPKSSKIDAGATENREISRKSGLLGRPHVGPKFEQKNKG